MKLKSIHGFSLTELSVSIAIIAMIAGAAISVAISSDENAKTIQTKSKLDRIEEALAGYLVSNGRLPCPADGSLSISSPTFGSEGTRTPASGGSTCASANFNDGTNVYYGVVPVRTLQLPDDFMFDGWGNRMSYIIDYRFANNSTTNSDCDGATSNICFADTAEGSLSVQDASSTNRLTNAIYVIFSHGKNAHGAFNKNGSATRINSYATSSGNSFTFAAELENSHLDASGANTALNSDFVLKEPLANEGGEYFDDIVRFASKSAIVKDTGVLFFDSMCRQAKYISENPLETHACTGATDEDSCEVIASIINERCLQVDYGI